MKTIITIEIESTPKEVNYIGIGEYQSKDKSEVENMIKDNRPECKTDYNGEIIRKEFIESARELVAQGKIKEIPAEQIDQELHKAVVQIIREKVKTYEVMSDVLGVTDDDEPLTEFGRVYEWPMQYYENTRRLNNIKIIVRSPKVVKEEGK